MVEKHLPIPRFGRRATDGRTTMTDDERRTTDDYDGRRTTDDGPFVFFFIIFIKHEFSQNNMTFCILVIHKSAGGGDVVTSFMFICL